MAKTAPDWTRAGTIAGYAEYLRKSCDAICVLVIRPHDSVFAVDSQCAPEDAQRLVEEYVPKLAATVDYRRREAVKSGSLAKAREAARLELGPNRE